MKCRLYFVCSVADGTVINTINIYSINISQFLQETFPVTTCIACCMMWILSFWKKAAVLLP